MYRNAPASGPNCDRHPVAEAVDRCGECRAHVCTPCAVLVGLEVLCPSCARWRRLFGSLRPRTIGLLTVLLCVAALATAVRGEWMPSADASAPPRSLDDPPCGGTEVPTMSEEVAARIDSHSAAAQVDRVITRCDAHWRVLLRRSFELHFRAGEHRQALAAADRLVQLWMFADREERIADYLLRSTVLQAVGDLVGSARDLESARELDRQR